MIRFNSDSSYLFANIFLCRLSSAQQICFSSLTNKNQQIARGIMKKTKFEYNMGKRTRLSVQQVQLTTGSDEKDPFKGKNRKSLCHIITNRSPFPTAKQTQYRQPFLQPESDSTRPFSELNEYKSSNVIISKVLPTLRAVDLIALPDLSKKSSKSTDILKKPAYLHNKSNKYVVQCEKLREAPSKTQKIFFISNLVLEEDLAAAYKLKSIQTKMLTKLKQIEKQRRNRNLITSKNIDKVPNELMATKLVRSHQKLIMVNRYEYDDNLRQKLDLMRIQKLRNQRLLNNNRQDYIEGWDIPENAQDFIRTLRQSSQQGQQEWHT